jgi:hypothetical protein
MMYIVAMNFHAELTRIRCSNLVDDVVVEIGRLRGENFRSEGGPEGGRRRRGGRPNCGKEGKRQQRVGGGKMKGTDASWP